MNSKVRANYDLWQGAVRKHEEMIRNARGNGLTPSQVHNMSTVYLVAVDVAFARLKQAEAEPERGPAELLKAAVRALAPGT
ncbi:MAG TPA: hypothetical protein VK604_07690 [Bryobacteraceae bacterium]|nr:hypothetical protein [Bryobacteraceae bacterium]